MGDLLTIAEARRACGVSPHVLRRAIRTGRIAATWDTSVYPPRYRVCREDLTGIRGAWRVWHDHEDDALVAMLGKMPMRVIAQRLDRSVNAVKHRMHRLGANSRVGESHYTASQASSALGVTREGVLDWIRRGEITTLRYRPVWGRVRCRLIAHQEIERFIRDRITGPPRKYPSWTWRRIPPGYFRNYAAAIAARSEGYAA